MCYNFSHLPFLVLFSTNLTDVGKAHMGFEDRSRDSTNLTDVGKAYKGSILTGSILIFF